MKTTGLIFSYDEIEDLNEKDWLNDLQLLDDNGGDPYGNCVIVCADKFTSEELKSLGLENSTVTVYYTQDFEDEMAELDFKGKWWAKGCTGEACFTEKSDFKLISK